jgi:predicted lipid-binding transport protein (Tim44 family)
MRKALALFAVVLTLGMTTLAFDADAKRLGGGKSAGMQRQAVTQPAHTPGGAQPGSPAQTAPAAGMAAGAAAPAAAAAKRSWMGPIAGIAAGLGIAALASHFGFGEALGNFMTMALIAMAVVFVIGFFLRKKAAAQGGALAGAGGVGNLGRGPQDVAYRQADTSLQPVQPQGGSLIGSRIGGGLQTAVAGATGTIPAGFDVAAFERTAKDQFVALQAANDARDLNRLRDYLSPELFEAAQAEIAERGDAKQDTQVFGLQAQVLEVVEEPTQYIVSVRFIGSIREQQGAETEDLREVWHLVKPTRGMGGWTIAGIQQG